MIVEPTASATSLNVCGSTATVRQVVFDSLNEWVHLIPWATATARCLKGFTT